MIEGANKLKNSSQVFENSVKESLRGEDSKIYNLQVSPKAFIFSHTCNISQYMI